MTCQTCDDAGVMLPDATPCPTCDRAAKVAALNDAFRRSFEGGRVVMTQGVAALPIGVQYVLQMRVRTYDFDAADPGNDPYRQHDFGVIEDGIAGRVFWKIDYYDAALEFGSEDPTDPAQTTRVLTIMLAGEY